MKIKNLIFVVEDAIFNNDGYKSRLEMEMELLKHRFVFFALVPGKSTQLSFRCEVKIVSYDAFDSSKPFILNMYKLESALKKLISEIGTSIIYCEALPSAICSLKVAQNCNCKLIFDCHGSAPDEVYLYHKNILGKIFSIWLRIKQKEIVEKCNMLVTVSRKQYEIFNSCRPYALLPMIPASHFFDERNYRDKYRQKLGINSDKQVFCYAGQMQKWQMAEETINFFKKIEDKLSNALLLVLTANVEDFTKIIVEKNIKNYIVLSVPYLEMPKYLDVADYGFCLRSDHIINRVASPTKVLEYISRNVQPIITEFVGDFSKLLLQDKKASVIKNWEVEEIQQIDILNGIEYVNNFVSVLKENYISMIYDLCDSND